MQNILNTQKSISSNRSVLAYSGVTSAKKSGGLGTSTKSCSNIDIKQEKNSADYDNRENYPTYLEYKYNTPYKRQYSLERNIVSNSVSAYKVNDVAYDWGLITESPILGWVLYTEFTPPKGYYPTNHVLFNYTANYFCGKVLFKVCRRYFEE